MATWLKFICAISFALLMPLSSPSAAQSQPPSIGDALVTRTYKLDSAKILKLGTTLTNKPSEKHPPSDILRSLLKQEGIVIPTTNVVTSRPTEKAFYFNDRTGELTLRACRRDIPKFEKYLAQIAAAQPRVELETFAVEIPDRFESCVILYGPTNWISAPNLQVLTSSNQLQTLLGTLPTNSFTYTMPPKSTIIRLLSAEELLPQNTPPIIPNLPADKSLFIRGDSQ